MTTNLVLTNATDLADFNFVETGLLTELAGFTAWQQRIQRLYVKLIASDPHLEYRQYQVDDAAILCCRQHHVITHGLGLGKTTISLLAVYALYHPLTNHKPGSIQICVPNLLSANRWSEDLTRINALLAVPLTFEIISNERQLRESTAPIFIYNHDLLKNRCRAYAGNRPTVGRWLRRHRQPRCLIIDEVHNCQAKSARTQQLALLGRKAKRRIALTGTLTELKHVHTVCNLIYRDLFPYKDQQTLTRTFSFKHRVNANYTGRAMTHAAPERYLRKLDTRKAPEYYNLIRRYLYRVRIDDPHVRDCITVPKNNIVLKAVEPSTAQLEAHQRYLDEYQQQLALATEQNNARALRLIIPLISIANNLSTELSPSPKLEALRELVLNSQGKVAIFCHYVSSARLVTTYLQRCLSVYQVVRLYAKDELATPPTMTQEQQLQAQAEFQHDPLVKVGVFSINLASQSIDLTAASDVVFYCCSWSAIQMQQALRRAVRPGNFHPAVNSYYLYSRGLIDSYQVTLVVEKIKSSKMLMDLDLDDLEADEDLSPAETVRRLLAR